MEFSEGFRFNVDSAVTVTELGKFDIAGNGLAEDALVALFNWDTGAKIVEATILAGTPKEETGSWDTHFVDVPDVLLTPGTDYLLAVEVGPFDATYTTDGTFISTFVAGIHRVEGRFTPVGSPEMPATADGFTGSYAGDSYYGPNFKVAEVLPQYNFDVDRDSGAVTLSFINVDPFDIIGYSITSGVGALAPGQWKSINANYDGDGPNTADGGSLIGTVDNDDNWTELSATNSNLSEFEFDAGDGAHIAGFQTIELGEGVWLQNPAEDS